MNICGMSHHTLLFPLGRPPFVSSSRRLLLGSVGLHQQCFSGLTPWFLQGAGGVVGGYFKLNVCRPQLVVVLFNSECITTVSPSVFPSLGGCLRHRKALGVFRVCTNLTFRIFYTKAYFFGQALLFTKLMCEATLLI